MAKSARKVAFEKVERLCKERNLRLTPIRKRVLEILLEEGRALGAYEVLESLRRDGLKHQPPVAYRALEFLQENGFVHRVEGKKGYVVCTSPSEPHGPVLFVCDSCNDVKELRTPYLNEIAGGIESQCSLESASEANQHHAGKQEFLGSAHAIEILGCCKQCSEASELSSKLRRCKTGER